MKIFSVHAVRTDFLRYQVESLNYFCKDKFDYYCIDNFVDSSQSEFIKSECKDLNVNYIKFDNYQIQGCDRDHPLALNSIKNIANDDEINVILDFDIFLISSFSFVNYINGYDISGVYQQRQNFSIEYIGPFVVIVNENSDFSELNFLSGPGYDVGGETRHYIKNRKVKLMKHTSSLEFNNDENCFSIPYDIKYGSQIIETSFLHYYRGTNWNRMDVNIVKEKTLWLQQCLTKSKQTNILNEKYLNKYQTIFSHSLCFWNGSNQKFNSILNPYLN
jgi:hypothetical protein